MKQNCLENKNKSTKKLSKLIKIKSKKKKNKKYNTKKRNEKKYETKRNVRGFSKN